MDVTRGYAIRSHARATPHGVFAGVAQASFAAQAADLRVGTGHRAVTTPSAAWLHALAEQLVDDPEVLARLTLTTSPTLARRGDRYESERRGQPGAGPRPVSVRATPAAELLAESCQGGAPARQAIEQVEQRWPGVAPNTVAGVVAGMIRAGVLLHDLLPEDVRDDPLGHLLSKLPADEPARPALLRLRALLADADRHPPGAPDRARLLRESRDMADELAWADRPLRADTVADAVVTLPQSLARAAADAAGLLWRIGRGTTSLSVYHQAFRERYGPRRLVPLREVTDPAIGLGLPPHALTATEPAPSAERTAVLSRLVADALTSGRSAVTLDRRTVEELCTGTGGTPPRTAEVCVRVLAATSPDAAAGRLFLAVCPYGGSQDAGATTGRFAALLPGTTVVPSGCDTVAVAEIVTLPRSHTAGSVAPETGFAAYRIPVGVPPRPGDIGLDDLLLGSNGQHLVLWSASCDRPIVPVLYSRISPDLLPPLAQFLRLLGHAGEQFWHPWSWGEAGHGPWQPAVWFGRTLLAPARWVLPPWLVNAAASRKTWHDALDTWRVTTVPAPPPTVVTEYLDRRLPLELTHHHDRELLRRHIGRGLRALTEPLGGCDAEQAVACGPAGRHVLEVVVSLRRRAEPAAPPARAATTAVRPPGAGLYLPGGPWLSLAVRAPAHCQDTVLASLGALTSRWAHCFDRWFWLRFHDQSHGSHLRVRFHGRPSELSGTLLSALRQWGQDLHRQRLSGGYTVEPYEQEIERYGGLGSIGAAEDVFCADSALVLATLEHLPPGEDDRLIAAAVSAAAIARHMADGAVAALAGGRLNRDGHRRADALRARVRAAAPPAFPTRCRAAWIDRTTALRAYRQTLPPHQRTGCASDLIHLHCNRMVPGLDDKAMVRFLATDLLRAAPPHPSTTDRRAS
ncbi:lantibiotic dehydratase [Nonomuraea diastatica]|uniref:Lantibiotic dehydratase n=1 Tax=Nonomuraea diastatica TaxID=1848329 RepID=A0A4R4VQS0_9ACTN|nr:lantibiotic dehydratase [Nonomuraea diastatica]TDD07531.1 lantibiotic dehydratase [Nonomuraea diastatica]